jgi:hypothetical protein
MRYFTYLDYEYKIDLKYIPNNNIPIPAFDVIINNKNYYAVYNTGYKENIISKDILHELGIEYNDDDLNVTIPQIIVSNGIILNDIIFTVLEDNNDSSFIAFGLSAFNNYNVLIYYKQNKILLYNNDVLPNFLNLWVQVTNLHPDEGLYINGLVHGSMKIYLFWLSTGTTLHIGGIFNRHYNIGLDKSIPLTSLFRSSVYIGGKNFRNLYFYNSLSEQDKIDNNLENTSIDIILGYDFFKKYDIFIENNNKIIYLEKP